MASGKIARRSVVSDVAALIDSPEIAALIEELDALRWTGRKGYGVRALVGACLVKSLFALPTWTRVAALINEHPGLQSVLGASPSIWACYRFTNRLREQRPLLDACLDRMLTGLHAEHPQMGDDIAIDASDMPAYANGQRFVSRNGPERERFSDPDASWGHRSAISTRSGGGFYGFKIHAAVCTQTGLPVAWHVASARHNESRRVVPLLDSAHGRGFRVQTCAMDKGYDVPRVYAECETRGVHPVIPLRNIGTKQPEPLFSDGSRQAPTIRRGTAEFKALYRRRASVEREFGRLKHDYGFAPLRVRGLARVQLHADLVMLARLGQALSRTREVSVARAA